MASLAASAGVTTGALYKHFDGKADLFAAVITAELERTAKMYDGFDPADDASAAKSLAGYLSLQHVRHPEQGCPLPSLTPEIARADDAAKAAYQAGLLEIHAKLQRLTATSEDAWTLMAQNVGAVMLARAIPDEKLQRELLAALRRAGEKLLVDSPSHSSCPVCGPEPGVVNDREQERPEPHLQRGPDLAEDPTAAGARIRRVTDTGIRRAMAPHRRGSALRR